MGHKNYSKFSGNFKKPENNEVVNPVEENNEIVNPVEENNDVMEEVFNQVMDEIVTTTPVEKNVGVVTGCVKLNVRKKAELDSTVLCIINNGEEVEVDPENSSGNFYKVCTSSGVEGYCMKKYIEVK